MIMFGMGNACKRLWYNWFYMSEEGEGFQYLEIGINVTEITYHDPKGEGDRHYCDVTHNDGRKERIFNINKIELI